VNETKQTTAKKHLAQAGCFCYNIYMISGPPDMPTQEPEPHILSFEEFVMRDPERHIIPTYGNFTLYFDKGTIAETNREKKHYKKLALKHPELVHRLQNEIRNRNEGTTGFSNSESLKPAEKDLYEAYKIMRGYGVSDKDLIGYFPGIK
jgi:hypothetical protein